MKEFAFDVKLWACVRVQAADEAEARAKMANQIEGGLIINHEFDGLRIEQLTPEGLANDELIEIDGEAV
jgi:hypothetical protein